jgi:hypothetical protein
VQFPKKLDALGGAGACRFFDPDDHARKRIGARQPDVSKMVRGEFRQFSVERLLHFLVALNQDVEIVVKPHRDRRNAPALHVS